MSLKEELGNGRKHRKNIYEALADIAGKTLSFDQHKHIKEILLSYITEGQDDLIKRLVDANANEFNMKAKLDLLANNSHAICKKCAQVKIKNKFDKV